MFEVRQGGEDREENKARDENLFTLWLFVCLGFLEYEIPLNGGSETRRAIVEDYKEEFKDIKGLILEISSFSIKIRRIRNTDVPF